MIPKPWFEILLKAAHDGGFVSAVSTNHLRAFAGAIEAELASPEEVCIPGNPKWCSECGRATGKDRPGTIFYVCDSCWPLRHRMRKAAKAHP